MNIIFGEKLLDDAINRIRNPVHGIPIADFPEFNSMIGGLRSNELTILCGGTGTGKTHLLAALSASLLKSDLRVFVAPVEVGPVNFAKRVLTAFQGHDFSNDDLNHDVPLRDVLRKNMDSIIKNLMVANYEDRVDVDEMIRLIEFAQNTQGAQVAILDNLNFFLKSGSSKDINQIYDEAIHAFVMAVKRIKIHVILVMHPKKTESGKVLSEFDIKGSSTAVQEAANVLLFNRPNEKDIENGMRITQRELVFRKLRERGMNVGKKFYLDVEGGKYVESKFERESHRQDRKDAKANLAWNNKKASQVSFGFGKTD